MEIKVAPLEWLVVNSEDGTPQDVGIILREENGPRKLSISLAGAAFYNLNWEMNNESRRPMLPTFLMECLGILDGSIEKMVVHDIADDDGVYQSYLTLRDNKSQQTYNINLQVTSALVVAVASKCPIFILDTVFEKKEKMAKIFPFLANLDVSKATIH